MYGRFVRFIIISRCAHSKHSNGLAFLRIVKISIKERTMYIRFLSAVSLVGIYASFCFTTYAVAPPLLDFIHDADTPYETLSAYRKRINITFTYEPLYISPQHCRFLTELQCSIDDEAAGVRSHQLREQQRHRNLQNNYVTTGNKIKILTLLVRFSDHKSKQLPPRSYYDQLLNGGEVNPVGGLSEWLFANSRGRYDGMYRWRIGSEGE